MPLVEALCDVPFGVGVKPKGTRFEATVREANLLVALKRARVVESEAAAEAAPATAKQDAAPESAQPRAEEVAKTESKPEKRKYQRRDMRARD